MNIKDNAERIYQMAQQLTDLNLDAADHMKLAIDGSVNSLSELARIVEKAKELKVNLILAYEQGISIIKNCPDSVSTDINSNQYKLSNYSGDIKRARIATLSSKISDLYKELDFETRSEEKHRIRSRIKEAEADLKAVNS